MLVSVPSHLCPDPGASSDQGPGSAQPLTDPGPKQDSFGEAPHLKLCLSHKHLLLDSGPHPPAGPEVDLEDKVLPHPEYLCLEPEPGLDLAQAR